MVSIIIPVYNVENYLRRCLDSVVNQTYQGIEVILVNDGSTDNSLCICQEYSEKYPYIKTISQQNQGLSAARNAGLEVCQGEWVTFIDSDDWICADYIETLFSLATNYSADISVCDIMVANDETTDISQKGPIIVNELVLPYEKQVGMRISVWCKLYRAKLFETVRFPVGKLHEDNFVTYKLYDMANKIVVSSEKKYFYYVRLGSIINSKYSERRLDVLLACKERIAYFEAKSDMKNVVYSCFNFVTVLLSVLESLKKSSIEKKKSLIKDCKNKLNYYAKIVIKSKLLDSKRNMFCRIARISPKIANMIVQAY